MTTDPSPKIPLWVFVVSDVALLATAWLIAENSRHPLSPAAVSAVAACAALGTLVLLVPLLIRYERQKNEVLDERQRALEGIARTVHESAEQLSIAANGLNQIATLARQSLQTAEGLPAKLQAQISAFETKATSTQEAERARLEKELASLRKTNGEQLTALATQIALATAEWTKLETASRTQLALAKDSLGQLDQQTATKVAAAHAHALTELDARLATLTTRIADNTPAPATTPAPTDSSAVDSKPAAQTEAPVVAEAALTVASHNPNEATPTGAEPEPAPTPPAAPAPAAPKKPRKPRREATPASTAPEPLVVTPAVPTVETAAAAESVPPSPVSVAPARDATAPKAVLASVESAPTPLVEPAPAAPPAEPAPVIAAAAAEPTPSVPAPVTSPTVSAPAETPTVNSTHSESATPKAEPAPEAAPAETPRRRTARAKPEPAPEPMLDLAIDDSAPPARTIERGLSSDGATRMIVTAYIGIGNRLFVRGEGPGLSRDKGVPLQFVSIGKWRWETNDAAAPIRFRILKNDTTECVGLGEQSLEPGYQAEFNATF